MSDSVDRSILDLQVNSREFTQGVSTSVDAIDRLKKSLDFKNSDKSIGTLGNAIKNIDLSGIERGVGYLSNRFSTLGIVGMTAIENITNSAVNYGKRMVSSLTIDPIKSGLNEYETKMNSITTILTNTKSKGTTLDDVTATLDELNTYADKTIYNFAEMTRNIGTFTAAGIDLKTSATSIKGIANLAAGSGSNAQQASTAMYQLSQALAAGSVKLQDWNSVVNAGMGGELFQKALKETAKGMGIVVDESKPFRESLQDGWITADVLTKTLSKFAEDADLLKAATEVKTFTQIIDTMKESVQSGWAQSWENIIGNKDEAAKFFTAINDGFGNIVGSSAEARNQMLSFWKTNGGRDALINALANSFKGLVSILTPIKKGMEEIFPPLTAVKLIELSKKMEDISSKFKMGDETLNKIKHTFKGFFAIIDIGLQAVFAIGKGIGTLVSYIYPASDGLLDFTATLGDFLVGVSITAKKTDFFNNVVQTFVHKLVTIGATVRDAIASIASAFGIFDSVDLSGMNKVTTTVEKRFQPLTWIGQMLTKTFNGIVSSIIAVAPVVTKIGNVLGKAFTEMMLKISGSIQTADYNTLFDILNGGLFAGILFGITKFMGSITKITDGAGGFLSGITDVLDGVKGSLEAYQNSIKAGTLLKIAISMGILSASLVALSLVDSKKLSYALTAMTVMFGELFAMMAGFEKLSSGAGFKGVGKVAIAMIGMSIAVGILSSAIVKISKVDYKGLVKGLAGIGTAMGLLVASAKVLAMNGGTVMKGGVSMMLYAAAINLLSIAVTKLGALDGQTLAKGLITVGTLLTELALFSKIAGGSKKMASIGIGVALIGGAMLLLSDAIVKIGAIPIEQIGKGLVGIAGVLVAISLATKLMPKNMIGIGLGLIAISVAVKNLSEALASLGKMSWTSMAKGLVAMAGSLAIIAGAMYLMSGAIPGALATLVVAGALGILTPVLITLGGLQFSTIATGLGTLVGIFVVLGAAGFILAGAVPAILGLGAGVALLGVGLAAAGGGLLLFSAGLAALVTLGAAGATALGTLVGVIVNAIPETLKSVGKGIVNMAKVIGDGATVIGKAFLKIISSLLDTIKQAIPKIVDTGTSIIVSLLTALTTLIPKVVDTGLKIILGLLQGIESNIGKMVASGIGIMVNFINGISSKVGDVIQAGVDLILSFINGIANAIDKNTQPMIDAIENLMKSVVKAGKTILVNAVGDFADIGKNIADGVVNGIKDNIQGVKDAAAGMANASIDVVKEVLGIHSPSLEMSWTGEMIALGQKEGIEKGTPKVEEAARAMAEGALKGVQQRASIDAAAKAGTALTTSMAGGVKTGTTTVSDAAKKAFDAAVKSIDDRKYYNKLTLEQEYKEWQKLQSKYKTGTEERDKADREAYRVKNELQKQEYDNSVNWIEDRKYYNQLSLQQEYDAWTRIQKRYLAGTEERKKADRELYRLKQELIDAEYQHSVDWIDNEQYYGRLTLKQELEAWQRVQKRYKAGSEERIKADKEVFRVQSEIASKRKEIDDDYYQNTKDINDQLKADIESLNQQYTDAVNSRADSIYGAYGMFDKLEEKSAVSGTTLLANLSDQVNAIKDWKRDIASLAGRGLNADMLDELEAMGPQSASQIKAIANMSNGELSNYVDLWKQKHYEAKEQAVVELDGLKTSTSKKIDELTATANTKLAEYQNAWTKNLSELGVKTGLKMEEIVTSTGESITKIVTATSEALSSTTSTVNTEFANQDWSGIGRNMVLGITKGITDNGKLLTDAVAKLGRSAVLSIRAALGIHSPSKEFEVVGMYANQGLAKGITGYSSNVISAAENVGKTTLEALRASLSTVSESINSNINLNPTIRPVVDLGSASKTIDDLFAASNMLNVSASSNKVAFTATNVNGRNSASDGTTNNINSPTTIELVMNNYVRNDADVKAISSDLQSTINRYQKAKGVLVK